MYIQDISWDPNPVSRGYDVGTYYAIKNTDTAIQTVKGFFVFTDPNDAAVCGFNIPEITVQSKGEIDFITSCRIPFGAMPGQYRYIWELTIIGSKDVESSGSGKAFVVRK